MPLREANRQFRESRRKEAWSGNALHKRIELERKLLLVLAAFRLPTSPDRFAELAQVFSIEGLFQGLSERSMLREADYHSRPGDRLQNCPMRSHPKNDRADNQPSLKPKRHWSCGTVGPAPRIVKEHDAGLMVANGRLPPFLLKWNWNLKTGYC